MIRIKRVKNKDNWELVNCPDDIYDELDQRGLIPEVGIVSFPGNTAIRQNQLPVIIELFMDMGIEYIIDYHD